MARIKLKDLNPPGNISSYLCRQPESEFDEFYALLFNAVKVTDSNGNDVKYVVARRIKELILNNSYIGYFGLYDLWTNVVPGADRNNLNLPINGQYILPNGRTFVRKFDYEPKDKDGAYIINSLPGGLIYTDIIRRHTDVMLECDIAIAQNLGAIKSPYFVVVKDKNTRLSIEQAIQQKQQGMPVIVVSSDIYDSFKGIPLDTPIVFDKIYEFRQKVRDNLLTKLSTLTSNKDKKERVQSAEVTAGVGECEDYLYALLDNFNLQCKTYGLNFRLENNSSLEELYTPNNEEETI